MPDLLNAKSSGMLPKLRNPDSTRPWTYILDALLGYIQLADYLVRNGNQPSFNFGPKTVEKITVSQVAQIVFNGRMEFEHKVSPLYEQENLLLDSELANTELNWKATRTSEEAIRETVKWHELQLQSRQNSLDILKLSFKEFFDKSESMKIKFNTVTDKWISK
jgi:CDP-glucose 4,6-dehydratase